MSVQRNGKFPAPKSVPLQFGSADLGNQTELPEAAGSYGNEPEESTRHHSQSPPPRSPSLPLSLTLQVLVAAPSQGTPPSPTAAGSRALRRAGPEPLTLLRAPPGQPLPSVGCARPAHVPPAPTARALAPFGPFSPAPRCWLALPGLTSGIREKLEAAEQTHPDQ